MPGHNRRHSRGESLLRFWLLAIVVLAALPFGCIEDWSRWLLIDLLLAAFCLFLWTGVPIALGRREWVAIGLGGVYLLWLGCQIVPLPPWALARVSPAAHRLYEIAVPGYAATEPAGYGYPELGDPGDASPRAAWVTPVFGAARTISLNPYGTYRNLAQAGALIGFLIMGASLFRSPRHRTWLVVTLVGLAGFEAVYGAAESLTGHQHIFWYAKLFYKDVATGTLVNRNHYAAMLNLVLPLVLALLLARPARMTVPLGFLPARMRLAQILDLCREPLLLSAAVAIGIAIVLSRSRMGLAAMFAGVFGFSLLMRRQVDRAGVGSGPWWRSRAGRAWTLPLLLLLGIGLYSLGTDALPTLQRLALIPKDLEASSTRPELWREASTVVRQYLWAGAGSGAFPYALNPALKNLPLKDFWDFDHAHNDYLETVSTVGLIGCLLGAAALALLCVRRPATLFGTAAMAGLVTIAAHSATDFLLVIPSNALLACALIVIVIAPDGEVPASRIEGSSARRLRLAVIAVIVIATILMPARSMLAAAIYRPQWNSSWDDPGVSTSLESASAIEPWNPFYTRTLAQGILSKSALTRPESVVLGDGLAEQAMRVRLDVLRAFTAGHEKLLRCLDLSPVDYSLHAEIAQSASEIRALARECGLASPTDTRQGLGLASPQAASVALSPTAYPSHIALAASLWKERAFLGEGSVAWALELLNRTKARPGLDDGWKEYLVGITDDGPSLARLDGAAEPLPYIYAQRLTPALRETSPALSTCAMMLRMRAQIREASEAIEPLVRGEATVVPPLTTEDAKRWQGIRAMLQAVAKAASAPWAQEPGICGAGEIQTQVIVAEASRLLTELDGRVPLE